MPEFLTVCAFVIFCATLLRLLAFGLMFEGRIQYEALSFGVPRLSTMVAGSGFLLLLSSVLLWFAILLLILRSIYCFR